MVIRTVRIFVNIWLITARSLDNVDVWWVLNVNIYWWLISSDTGKQKVEVDFNLIGIIV